MIRGKSISIFAAVAAFLGVFSLAQPHAALAVDNPLVDTQQNAVATNLGLFGGSPMDITVSPTDTDIVFVATYTPNGIFRSTDGGQTWQGLPNDTDYGAGKAVAINESGTVYALISDTVLRSDDGGETWTELGANLDNLPVILGDKIAVSGDALLVAANGGTIQRSTDEGDSFTEVEIDADDQNSVITLTPVGASTVYAVVQNQFEEVETLYRSTDSGATWTNMNVTDAGVPDGSRFYGVAVDPTDSDHVVLTSYHPDYHSYQSFNAGETWSVLTNNGNHVGGREAAFDSTGRLYIGVQYTDNAEAETPTWTALTFSTPLSSITGDIFAIDPENEDTLYTNSGLGVAKSTNAGESWTDAVDGMTAVKTYDISQTTDKSVVWIGANGGLAKTENFLDDEPEWEYPILPAPGLSNLRAVWVQPDDADVVVAGASTFLNKSTDGGETWTQADAPEFTGQIYDIVQSPTEDDRLYAIYRNTSLVDDPTGGVFVSEDTGSTWEDMELPNDVPANALAVTEEEGSDVLYVGLAAESDTTGIYSYIDGGWELLEEDFNGLTISSVAVHPENSDMVFATVVASSTEAGLYKSEDAGDNWTQITDGIEDVNHLDNVIFKPTQPGVMFMTGQQDGTFYGMVYKSTNSGNSWSEYYTGKRQEFFYALFFDGLLTGNDRGLYGVDSLAKVKIKVKKLQKPRKHRFTITLQDAATKKKLKKQTVKIYKKRKGKPWKFVQTVKTNKKGTVKFVRKAKKNTQFKAVWKPKKKLRSEYRKSVSRIVKTR